MTLKELLSQYLGYTKGREIFPASEVQDMLLELWTASDFPVEQELTCPFDCETCNA